MIIIIIIIIVIIIMMMIKEIIIIIIIGPLGSIGAHLLTAGVFIRFSIQ